MNCMHDAENDQNMKRLAIVIPAYKAAYLDETLRSIATQTCKAFVVYVGDDASAYDLRSICERWQHDIDLRYYRFENNLGLHDLVAQWERCVALSREPWICLFCDDDSMEPECVEMFYREMSLTGDSYSIYHFNVDIIDASGNLIRVPAKFPRILSGREFAIKRFNFQISSFVSEYIFARKAFKKVGGFQSFPRGWCSDDATWIKLASGSGIKTIAGPKVKWRYSGQNICSLHEHDREEKIKASIQYLEWIDQYFRTRSVSTTETTEGEKFIPARTWLYKQLRSFGASLWDKDLWKRVLWSRAIDREPLLKALSRMLLWDFKINVIDKLSALKRGTK